MCKKNGILDDCHIALRHGAKRRPIQIALLTYHQLLNNKGGPH